MIKLVVSDVDGTLLKAGETLPEETFSMIRRLKEMGILFAAASGRPFLDLRRLFARVEDDMAFIASDGALVRYRSQVIGKFPMDREPAFSLMREVYEKTEAEVVLYGEHMAYMIPKEKQFEEAFRSSVHNHVIQVGCMRKVEEDYLKVGVYHKEDVIKYAGSILSYWNEKFHPVYVSRQWAEFTGAGVNKGVGLDQLAKTFGMKPEEILVFGDNTNDLEMLRYAGYGYAMSHAGKAVKEVCGYQTGNVLETIQELLLK